MIYFTSDTHFNRNRPFKLSKRPFPALSIFDTYLITNWNNTITNLDTVYHLGDFGDPRVLKLLNGKEIVLIRGNHDTFDVIKFLEKDSRFRMGKCGEFFKPEKLFRMVHKPSRAKSKNCFYLYGHIHGAEKTRFNGLNVCVDCHDFKPVSFDDVLWWKEQIMEGNC